VRQLAAVLACWVCACSPQTSRPAITPLPQAVVGEVALLVPAATQRIADVLVADSLPLGRVVPRDGYIESPWFDARTLQPTRRRVLGPDVVRLRAWADPERPGHSTVTVEVVYHPMADPSLPERELERTVPLDHAVLQRVRSTLGRAGISVVEPAARPAGKPAAAPERAKPVADSAVPANQRLLPQTPSPADSAGAAPRPAPKPAPKPAAPPAPATPRPSAPPATPADTAPSAAAASRSVAPAPAARRYIVQSAAVPTQAEADRVVASIRGLGLQAAVVRDSSRLLKVRTSFATRAEAEAALERIRRSVRPDAFLLQGR
jgi:hypothetical protein